VREVVPDGPDHELCLGQALGQHPLLVRADRARVQRQVGRSVPTELREPLVAPPAHLFEDRFVERVYDRGETLLRECRRATVPG
jgi:hypothetical protein